MKVLPALIEEVTNVKISRVLQDFAALTFKIEGSWLCVEEVAKVRTSFWEMRPASTCTRLPSQLDLQFCNPYIKSKEILIHIPTLPAL